MASIAGSSKKKRDRTKDRQRRKAKQQNQFADPGSEVTTDDELDDNAIYGPRNEKKKDWDARLGSQPTYDASWGAFQRRAKARRGKPIEYEHPMFTDEQTLSINASDALGSKLLSAGGSIRQLVFEPGVNVNE